MFSSDGAVMLRSRGHALGSLQERNSHQQNENGLLDTSRTCSFYSHSSSVPITLIGQEGIRCAAPLQRQGKSGAAPATVGGESSFTCHWVLPCKTWEGGEG